MSGNMTYDIYYICAFMCYKVVRLSFFCSLSTFHLQIQFMNKKSVDFSIVRLRH